MTTKKQMPKHVIDKLERINRHLDAAMKLREQVEEWLEHDGVTDWGYDFMTDYRIAEEFMFDIEGLAQFYADCADQR